MSELISCARDDRGIYTMEICRPEVRNALNPEAFVELVACCAEIDADPRARAVVLRGQFDDDDATTGPSESEKRKIVRAELPGLRLLCQAANVERCHFGRNAETMDLASPMPAAPIPHRGR